MGEKVREREMATKLQVLAKAPVPRIGEWGRDIFWVRFDEKGPDEEEVVFGPC